MTQTPPSVRRLVFGASPFVEPGHGEIFDAAELDRLAAAAAARTWRELVEDYYGEAYETFVAEYELGAIGPADDASDFGAWYSDSFAPSPQQIAWEAARRRVAELARLDPSAFADLTSRGGSPVGHEDSISGPLESLTALAAQIRPEADGFSLERDDHAVTAAFSGLFA